MIHVPLVNRRHEAIGHAIVDDGDAPLVLAHRWYLAGGYAATYVGRGRSISMHRLIMSAPADRQVDHKNGNRIDNRRENLRLCSNAENARGMRKRRRVSRYRGLRRRRDRWEAYITQDGKTVYLGSFGEEQAAAEAYDAASRRLYGEFGLVNFPREGERSDRSADAA